MLVTSTRKNIPTATSKSVDMSELRELASGFSNSELQKLLNEVENIFSGGKQLIEAKSNNSAFNLSVEVIQTSLLGKPYKLITINDIKKEIEQKELSLKLLEDLTVSSKNMEELPKNLLLKYQKR